MSAMSEYRRHRKDIKKRARQAMDTSRKLLVARARIIELEAAAGTTMLQHRSEVGQLTADRDSWRRLATELTGQKEEEQQRVADTESRLLALEEAVAAATKLLAPHLPPRSLGTSNTPERASADAPDTLSA